jgi:hypothetical protein
MENRFLITYHPSFMMPWLEMVRPGWSWFALAGAGSPWLELVRPGWSWFTLAVCMSLSFV